MPNQNITSKRRGRPPSDGGVKGVRKGSRLQISLTIAPELLSRVDGLADAMGQTRAALINLAIYRLLSQEAPTEPQAQVKLLPTRHNEEKKHDA